jgi:hypothetical protein
MEDKVDGSKIIEIGEGNGVYIYAHNNKNHAVYRLNGAYAEMVNFVYSHKGATQRAAVEGLGIDLKTCRKIRDVLLDLKIIVLKSSSNKSNQKVSVMEISPLFHFHGSGAIIVFRNFVSW